MGLYKSNNLVELALLSSLFLSGSLTVSKAKWKQSDSVLELLAYQRLPDVCLVCDWRLPPAAHLLTGLCGLLCQRCTRASSSWCVVAAAALLGWPSVDDQQRRNIHCFMLQVSAKYTRQTPYWVGVVLRRYFLLFLFFMYLFFQFMCLWLFSYIVNSP